MNTKKNLQCFGFAIKLALNHYNIYFTKLYNSKLKNSQIANFAMHEVDASDF